MLGPKFISTAFNFAYSSGMQTKFNDFFGGFAHKLHATWYVDWPPGGDWTRILTRVSIAGLVAGLRSQRVELPT